MDFHNNLEEFGKFEAHKLNPKTKKMQVLGSMIRLRLRYTLVLSPTWKRNASKSCRGYSTTTTAVLWDCYWVGAVFDMHQKHYGRYLQALGSKMKPQNPLGVGFKVYSLGCGVPRKMSYSAMKCTVHVKKSLSLPTSLQLGVGSAEHVSQIRPHSSTNFYATTGAGNREADNPQINRGK